MHFGRARAVLSTGANFNERGRETSERTNSHREEDTHTHKLRLDQFRSEHTK